MIKFPKEEFDNLIKTISENHQCLVFKELIPRKPLKIGIKDDLQVVTGFDPDKIDAFLKWYTHCFFYYKAILNQIDRFDLDNNLIKDSITEEHKNHAKLKVSYFKKKLNEKEKLKKLSKNKKVLNTKNSKKLDKKQEFKKEVVQVQKRNNFRDRKEPIIIEKKKRIISYALQEKTFHPLETPVVRPSFKLTLPRK